MSVVTALQSSEAGNRLRRQVEDGLRAAIISGEYGPGERLRERHLIERFGVSRTLLREALRQIEAEGLVVSEAHRGAMVTTIGYEDAADIYEIRGALEAQACSNFADQGSASQRKLLQESYQRLDHAARDGDVGQMLAVKSEFYGIIIAGCGNRLIGEVLGQLNNRISLLRRASLAEKARIPDMLAEIAELVEAISAHDTRGAAVAALHHVRQAGRAALRTLRQNETVRNPPPSNIASMQPIAVQPGEPVRLVRTLKKATHEAS